MASWIRGITLDHSHYDSSHVGHKSGSAWEGEVLISGSPFSPRPIERSVKHQSKMYGYLLYLQGNCVFLVIGKMK